MGEPAPEAPGAAGRPEAAGGKQSGSRQRQVHGSELQPPRAAVCLREARASAALGFGQVPPQPVVRPAAHGDRPQSHRVRTAHVGREMLGEESRRWDDARVEEEHDAARRLRDARIPRRVDVARGRQYAHGEGETWDTGARRAMEHDYLGGPRVELLAREGGEAHARRGEAASGGDDHGELSHAVSTW